MLPLEAVLRPAADFARGEIAGAGHVERAHRVAILRRRLVSAVSGSDQKLELPQHVGEGAGPSVVPARDSFGGIAPEDVLRAYVILLATAFTFGAIVDEIGSLL